jgi:hypothetical protein
MTLREHVNLSFKLYWVAHQKADSLVYLVSNSFTVDFEEKARKAQFPQARYFELCYAFIHDQRGRSCTTILIASTSPRYQIGGQHLQGFSHARLLQRA